MVEPRLLLVHLLRDHLGLTGTHVGCDTTNCGACTVHLDGEAVSVVDAAEQVVVDYEPKPAVVDPEKALEDGSPLVWEQFGTNKTHEWGLSGGDIEAGLAEADVVVERRLVNHRIAGAPIEPRGSIAELRGDSLTLYSSTQIPHIARFVLSGMLGIAEDKLRVVAPDAGGGFGAKLQVYAEEALVLVLAKRLGRPVKWTESRTEHLTTSHHGRDQINHITLAAKRDGTLTACRARIIADLGAYQQLLTAFIPELGFPVMGGCYKIPAIDLHFEGVFTNKFATDAVRGAGRPEATYWIELTMDVLARELDMDPLELRRRNFIGKDESPTPRRWASPTTQATTRERLTGCSSTSTASRFAASRSSCASRVCIAAWASRPGSRSAGWRPRAPSARRASGFKRRSGSRRWSASIPRARPRCSPAPRRTARAWIRASRRSRPTAWVSTPRTSTSSTATPTRGPGGGAPTAHARCRSAARRSRGRPRRCRRRPSASARPCSRPRPRTSSWSGKSSRCAARPTKG